MFLIGEPKSIPNLTFDLVFRYGLTIGSVSHDLS